MWFLTVSYSPVYTYTSCPFVLHLNTRGQLAHREHLPLNQLTCVFSSLPFSLDQVQIQTADLCIPDPQECTSSWFYFSFSSSLFTGIAHLVKIKQPLAVKLVMSSERAKIKSTRHAKDTFLFYFFPSLILFAVRWSVYISSCCINYLFHLFDACHVHKIHRKRIFSLQWQTSCAHLSWWLIKVDILKTINSYLHKWMTDET